MIPWRGWLYGIGLFAAAALVIALGRLSGTVQIVLANVEYTLRLPVVALLLLAFVLVGGFVFWLVRRAFMWPRRYRQGIRTRQIAAAREAMADAYLALNRGDFGAARAAISLTQNRLPDETLPQMLAAQLAIQTGAFEEARARLTQLHAQNPKIAEQGLFQLAQASDDPRAGQQVLEQSLRRDPKNRWALEAALHAAVGDGAWDRAAALAPQLQAAGLWSRAEMKRHRAMIYVSALTAKQTPEAHDRRIAEQAVRDWGDVPALCELARLYAAMGQVKKARQRLAKAWAIAPHPDLAAAFLDIHHELPVDQHQRLATAFIRGQAEHAESLILRARLAMKARHWAHAERLLAPLWEGDRATKRVCGLMADLKTGEGDVGGARGWRDRAISAPEDASWHADGERLARWYYMAPRSQRLDGVRWGHPERQGLAHQRNADAQLMPS